MTPLESSDGPLGLGLTTKVGSKILVGRGLTTKAGRKILVGRGLATKVGSKILVSLGLTTKAGSKILVGRGFSRDIDDSSRQGASAPEVHAGYAPRTRR